MGNAKWGRMIPGSDNPVSNVSIKTEPAIRLTILELCDDSVKFQKFIENSPSKIGLMMLQHTLSKFLCASICSLLCYCYNSFSLAPFNFFRFSNCFTFKMNSISFRGIKKISYYRRAVYDY